MEQQKVMKAVAMGIKAAARKGGNCMVKVAKQRLIKKKLPIKLFFDVSTASVGAENCCNGSFACCGASSCG